MRALTRLPAMRARAESRMTSRARVRHATGGTTPGPDGFDVPEWATVHTDIPFRLGGSDRGGAGTRTVRVGESEVQVAVRVGHFPADTTGLADGDLVEIIAGENAGGVYKIVEASGADQQTARRVPVVETQRPTEWDA